MERYDFGAAYDAIETFIETLSGWYLRVSRQDMVVWGSISLAQSLMAAGLIDEYRLVICPVVLGAGRPLFSEDVAAVDMKLPRARMLDLGAVSLKYVQRKARSAGTAARG